MLEPDQEQPRGDAAEPMRRELTCRLLDLNEDGAMVFAKFELSVGYKSRFQIRLFDDKKELIDVTSEVRWTERKDAKNGFAMGLQLSDMDAVSRQRLKDFLAKLDSTLGL